MNSHHNQTKAMVICSHGNKCTVVFETSENEHRCMMSIMSIDKSVIYLPYQLERHKVAQYSSHQGTQAIKILY